MLDMYLLFTIYANDRCFYDMYPGLQDSKMGILHVYKLGSVVFYFSLSESLELWLYCFKHGECSLYDEISVALRKFFIHWR